jgi:hypothetical protein
MKKSLIVVVVVLTLVVALGAAGFAYAQAQPILMRFGGMMSQYAGFTQARDGNGYGWMRDMMNGQGNGEYGSMGDMMEAHHGDNGWTGSMQDMMNGAGHMAGGMMGFGGEYGPMHQYMVDALAEALDLTAEELQARVEAGESMWDIAAGLGLSEDQVATLMQSAHDLAIDQALVDGAITQEQADWMNSHMLELR